MQTPAHCTNESVGGQLLVAATWRELNTYSSIDMQEYGGEVLDWWRISRSTQVPSSL